MLPAAVQLGFSPTAGTDHGHIQLPVGRPRLHEGRNGKCRRAAGRPNRRRKPRRVTLLRNMVRSSVEDRWDGTGRDEQPGGMPPRWGVSSLICIVTHASRFATGAAKDRVAIAGSNSSRVCNGICVRAERSAWINCCGHSKNRRQTVDCACRSRFSSDGWRRPRQPTIMN